MDINKAIEEFDPNSPEQFSSILKAALELPAHVSQYVVGSLASQFQVAPSTVRRWANGMVVPHSSLRTPIVSAIRGYLADIEQ
jgi:DNA-binding MurR/RpiR family transcriptional regulator